MTIAIFILQTFRCWAATSNLCPSMMFFISQVIRYDRAYSSFFECFILRASLGWYVKERLKSSLRKFYGRYGDLIEQFEFSLSPMLHDILEHYHIQWPPPLIRHYTNFDPVTELDLITEFDVLPICERAFATGVACQEKTLTPPPDSWSCPNLGLAWVLILRQNSPEFVLFPNVWVSNISRYFYFTFD